MKGHTNAFLWKMLIEGMNPDFTIRDWIPKRTFPDVELPDVLRVIWARAVIFVEISDDGITEAAARVTVARSPVLSAFL